MTDQELANARAAEAADGINPDKESREERDCGPYSPGEWQERDDGPDANNFRDNPPGMACIC